MNLLFRTACIAFSLLLPSLAQEIGSQIDHWDLSQGTVVTASSPTYSETGMTGLLGGAGYPSEPGSTVFADGQSDGFIHFVEWATPSPVAIAQVRVYAAGDGLAYDNGREFKSVALKIRSGANSDFDITVFRFEPSHPYLFVNAETFLMLETNLTVFVANEFRMEFEQINLRPGYSAPRVMEVDAFGPEPTGPARILNQPLPRTACIGGDAIFKVGAIGDPTIVYQWQHAGTNLIESEKFIGVNSWLLRIINLSGTDAGDYSVVVRNDSGQEQSTNALLTVNIDNESPTIKITSPLAGPSDVQPFTLEGSAEDNDALESARWELNGRPIGGLTLTAGHFRLTSQLFDYGDNLIKVIAVDRSGNESFKDVLVTWLPSRVLALTGPPPVQEGTSIAIPISLISTGQLSGATFTVSFDTNFLAEPSLTFSPAVANDFTSVTQPTPRQLKATLLRSNGTTYSAGPVQIASLRFRTRAVSINTITQIRLESVTMYDRDGNAFTQNIVLTNAAASISKRKYLGDNNANDRLDAGDGTIIFQQALRQVPVRSVDRNANDINRNGDVDIGDVTKTLRAVVGLDAQPGPVVVPPNLPTLSGVLVADKLGAAPGEKVTVDVRLGANARPVTGASFRLEYPAEALRLENAEAIALGPIVRSGSVSVWNLSPGQNDFAAQNGVFAFAVSSTNTWAQTEGTFLRLAFTVQAAATTRFAWPLRLTNLEVSRDGYETEILGNAGMIFEGRAAAQPTLSNVTFRTDGTPTLHFQGEPDASYTIEASFDLIFWENLGEHTSANGAVSVEDTRTNGSPVRFYRAKVAGH